jgi:phage major head subunit gpT-like protein
MGMIKFNLQRFATPVQPNVTTNTHDRADFGKLLEPGLRKLFFETYKEIPEQFSKIYNILSSSKSEEHDYGMGAFGGWTKRTSDISEVSYQKISPGLERNYKHDSFTSGFMITREMYDDDQYNQMNKLPKALARAGRASVEKDAMTPLINGFSADIGGTGASAIYDGEPLFSATHPLLDSAKVGSNLVTGALTVANLEKAIKLMRETPDEAGNPMMLTPVKLIVPPALEFVARTILETNGMPGGNDNDINTMKGRLELVVMDYLGANAGGSDTHWFVQASEHELNFFWRTKTEFKHAEDFDTLVAKYRGYCRYSYGVSDFRGLIGSTGL